jgi:hypothetical protein
LFCPEGIDIDESIRATDAPGVDIIPAERGFRGHSAPDDPRPFARAAARFAPIPTRLRHLARDGAMRFSRLFFAVAMARDPKLAAFAIVPIQVDMRTHSKPFVLAQLMAEFGRRRIFRSIRAGIALAEAFGGRRPVRARRGRQSVTRRARRPGLGGVTKRPHRRDK